MKRALTVLLTLCLLFSLFPLSVPASDTAEAEDVGTVGTIRAMTYAEDGYTDASALAPSGDGILLFRVGAGWWSCDGRVLNSRRSSALLNTGTSQSTVLTLFTAEIGVEAAIFSNPRRSLNRSPSASISPHNPRA